jgi:DNA-binding CsgD family transcriptional regulator
MTQQARPEYITPAKNEQMPASGTEKNQEFALPGVPDMVTQNYAIWGALTNKQTSILVALAQNIMADNRLTDGQIAENLGIERKTLWNCRQNPTFSSALGLICLEIVRGNEDMIINKLFKALDKDWTVGKFLLQYSGSYVSTSKQLSLHADVTKQSQSASREQNIDEVLMEWGSKGLSIKWIAERWAKLKAEGAF